MKIYVEHGVVIVNYSFFLLYLLIKLAIIWLYVHSLGALCNLYERNQVFNLNTVNSMGTFYYRKMTQCFIETCFLHVVWHKKPENAKTSSV